MSILKEINNMANSFTNSYSSDAFQGQDAQNTAQRSDKKSEALMDDHKEVSSPDYAPSVPQSSSSDINPDTGMNTKTGEVGRVISNSTPSPYGREIGSPFIPSKHEADLVIAAKRKLEVEDLARHIQDKERLSWADATKRADSFLTLQSAKEESKIAMDNAKIAKQTRETQSLTARAKFEEEFAGISPADPDAPKKYNSVMAKYAPSLAGTSHFTEAQTMVNQGLTHTQNFLKFGQAQLKREQLEDVRQQAGMAMSLISGYSENELNDFMQSDDYKNIAGQGMIGRSVTAAIANRKKELNAIKANQMGASNPNLEIVGYDPKSGEAIYKKKKEQLNLMGLVTGDQKTPSTPPPAAVQPPANDGGQLPGDEGLTETDSSLGTTYSAPAPKSAAPSTAPTATPSFFPSGQIEIGGAKTRKPLSEIAPQ